MRQNDLDVAESLFEEALVLVPDPVPLANLTHLAFVHRDIVKARKRAEECLRLSRETGNDINAFMAQRELAAVAALEQRYDDAGSMIRALLEGTRHGDLQRHTIECVVVAAFITLMRGNEDDAETLVKAAVAERARLGMTPWELPLYPYAEVLIRRLEKNGLALSDGGHEALPLDDAVELALTSLDRAMQSPLPGSSAR
jgi:hypothetical protein